MIVDVHTHISCPVGDIDIARHLDICRKVDASVVLAALGDDGEAGNQTVGQYVKQHKKMIGFACINPLVDKVGTKSITAGLVEKGFKGAVLYSSQGRFHPAHSRAMRFYAAAEELKLPVFFHNSTPLAGDAVLDYAQPYLLDEIARTFPALKIIVGNMGIPFVTQTLCMLEKHQNVYADLAISPAKTWQVYNLVISAYETGVMDKLLFGSGFPSAEPDQCIETLLGFNKLLADTNLPTVPRELIRGIIERDTLTLLGIGPV